MDQDQTSTIRAFRSGSTLFVEEASKTFHQTTRQMTFVVNGTLRVKHNTLV